MRDRGQNYVFFLCLLLMSGIVHAEIPSHEHFSEADEDLFALLSFFADTKTLCEQTILHTYEANTTITFNAMIQMNVDEKKQNQSAFTSDLLAKKIRYSTDTISLLEHNGTSYTHLKTIFPPLKKVGTSIISIATVHSQLLNNFSSLVTLLNQQHYKLKDIFSKITRAHQHINRIQGSIDSVEMTFSDLETFFSIHFLQNQTTFFSTLLNKYESYLDQFISYVRIAEPKLVLYADKTDYYLGETINVSGYFMETTGLVKNQPINLHFNDIIFTQVITNKLGKYNASYQSTVSLKPVQYILLANTTYEDNAYASDPVEVIFHRIPTTLSITLSKNHYQPYETIHIKGRLKTAEGKGIQDTFFLSIENDTASIDTNQTGFFSWNTSVYSTYGSYLVQGRYEPALPYESCTSEETFFFVDELTMLSIEVDKKNIAKDDIISVSGYLQESISGNGIQNQNITLYVNGRSVQTVNTNETGFYTISYQPENQSGEQLFLQTKYKSQHKKWRSTTSPVQKINLTNGLLGQIIEGLFYSYHSSYVWILLVCMVCMILLLFGFLIYSGKKKQSSVKNNRYPSPFPYASQWKHIISPKKTKDNANLISNKPLSFKNKIISIYRTLLRFLSHQGIEMKETLTHRDIQKQLYTTKLSKEAVDSVTYGFERARYSPYQTIEDDVQAFDEQVFSLIKDYKE